MTRLSNNLINGHTLGLDEYTICLDDIRRMLGGTYLDVDGNKVIASTPAMEKKVISKASIH